VTEDPKDPKNANQLVYGRRIYAMRDGVIVACWRTAPENPRPFIGGEDESKELWLHPKRRAGLIGGGGNSVFIVHDDGTMALYAHMQPGTISTSLCPNNDTVYSSVPKDTDPENEYGLDMRANVPAAMRKRVKAGDFLGLAGNSGESKGPHTHVHVQKHGPSTDNDDWEGVPLTFRRGLAQPHTSGKVDIDAWQSFSGKMIPKGKTVFWPPTRLSDEYARHGLDDKLMPRTWTHLSNSGFMPIVLDCYSVGGDVFYNMVWRRADGYFRGYFGQTSSRLQDEVDTAKHDRLAPVFVESCSSRTGPRYSVVFKELGGAWRMRHDISTAEHDAELDRAKKDGFSPVNVSVVSSGGERRYTVLYRKQNLGGWSLKSQVPQSEYQGVINDEVKAKRYPVYLSAYRHDGKYYFSAIFAPQPSPNWTARHDLTASRYQEEYDAARGGGMSTRTVAGYDGSPNGHYFAAMWRK
jgi:hypothetical protein